MARYSNKLDVCLVTGDESWLSDKNGKQYCRPTSHQYSSQPACSTELIFASRHKPFKCRRRDMPVHNTRRTTQAPAEQTRQLSPLMNHPLGQSLTKAHFCCATMATSYQCRSSHHKEWVFIMRTICHFVGQYSAFHTVLQDGVILHFEPAPKNRPSKANICH